MESTKSCTQCTQIESKIRNFIFGTDGLLVLRQKDDFKNLAEYQKLKIKIAEYIWRYAEVLFPKGIRDAKFNSVYQVQDAGIEINEFALYFVEKKNFDDFTDQNGIFTYIKKSLNQRIVKAGREEIKNKKRQGIRLSKNKTDENIDREFSKLLKICKTEGKNISDEKTIEYLSVLTGKTFDEINELVKTHRFFVSGEFQTLENGEEISVFDTELESPNKEYDSTREEKYKTYFDEIQKKFDDTNSQPKQNGYLQSLLTREILYKLQKIETSRVLIADLLENYSFVDKTLLENWKNEESLPSQKEIAESKGKNPTTASRLLKKLSC